MTTRSKIIEGAGFTAFFLFLIFGVPWIFYWLTGQPLDFGGVPE